MTSAFSSADSAAIERTIEPATPHTSAPLQLTDIWPPARLPEVCAWLRQHAARKICLQFPDELLQFAATIAQQLKDAHLAAAADAGNVDVYILGDTSYGSCCVDEVAASHAAADAIVHFGHACLSRVVRLPVLHVFYEFQLDVEAVAVALQQRLAGDGSPQRLHVFYNVGYYYHIAKLESALRRLQPDAAASAVQFAQLAINTEPDQLCWTLAGLDLTATSCVYLGRDDQTLFNLMLSVPAAEWLHCDPTAAAAIRLQPIQPTSSAWMRRRNYYIEKCKDASALGIVVGTLAARGYLQIVKHLQALARHRNIRTYLISVGKVNPAKLANFMEIDCFVLIGCAENVLFTSRDFYAPLLSVYEVEMALNGAWRGQLAPAYSLVFADVLPDGRLHRDFEAAAAATDGAGDDASDVSLVTGRLRRGLQKDDAEAEQVAETAGGEVSKAVLLKKNHQLVGAEVGAALHGRSWTGLEAALGKAEAVRIEEGRSGIAMQYEENLAHK